MLPVILVTWVQPIAVQALDGDVKVIGFDGSPDGAQSILDGGMTATVAQTPALWFMQRVKALYELIVNGTV